MEKILSKRKDVFLHLDPYSDKVIQRVPGYNQDYGCNHYISFLWRPSVKDYRKMWKKCQELAEENLINYHPSTLKHQAVFDLDLLGIREASLYDSYYGLYGNL